MGGWTCGMLRTFCMHVKTGWTVHAFCGAGGILHFCVCERRSLREHVSLCHWGEQIFCVVITACVFLSVWLAGFHAAIQPTPCLTRPLTAGDLNAALQQPPWLMGYQRWRASTKEEEEEEGINNQHQVSSSSLTATVNIWASISSSACWPFA